VNITSWAVKKKTLTIFIATLTLLAGVFSYPGLGRLEDPEFAIKTAVVSTAYPGATAEEVELEVTDPIEIALQELVQVKELESNSRAGMSVISITIRPEFTAAKLPQVWDEIRKKVSDVSSSLPRGAAEPVVSDDFGDVYGFFFTVVGDGFTSGELDRFVDEIKKELSLVKNVSRVELWGNQSPCIYLDISQARFAQLGLTFADVQATLQQQNAVVDSGGMEIQGNRFRFETSGVFTSPEDIGDLIVQGQGRSGNSELIRIRDFAVVRRGAVEPPKWEMRYDGLPAIAVAISSLPGANAVEIGADLKERMAELQSRLPVGIEMHDISWQADQVSSSLSGFMVALAQAIGIVLVVLWISMGFRMAFIVGVGGLLFVIIECFLVMSLFGIDLQRMSLGALVIAMGMMVDNAIVVADGTLIRVKQGMDRVEASVLSGSKPAMALLGATLIAIMSFYPIFSSTESAGEYCATLFSVVAIALVASWLLSVTLVPLMNIAFLPKSQGTVTESGNLYSGRFYDGFRSLLRFCIRQRVMVLVAFVATLGSALFSFQFVDQMFFPNAAREQFMVDYWAPEGTRIQQVSADMRKLEDKVGSYEKVTAVSTFIGQGPPRFYLPVDPEQSYSSYGQLIVNTESFRDVDGIVSDLDAWVKQEVPEANIILRKFGIGPFESWPVEIRFSGPGVADRKILRRLAAEAKAIIEESPHAALVRTDWRQQTPKIELDYDERNARWTAVERADIANATKRAYDGLTVGEYREGDKFLPIILRHTEVERQQLGSGLEELQIRTPLGSEPFPLSQVTRAVNVTWEDPLIWRWDRRRAITVQAIPKRLASVLRADVKDELEAIELPQGYQLMWDGEHRSSTDAQRSLMPGMIPAAAIVALVLVGLFNAIRPPIIIVLLIPFAFIGVVYGLLLTGKPFGFVALLGAMSLAGMMIKNSIVLFEQINDNLAEEMKPLDAVIEAAVARLRPVLLAAATTILGVAPLLQDVFWVSMAVTIMFGLLVGSVLTMILLPVLYALFYGLPSPEKATTTN